jgi:protein involved in polysaccharide export with SLBB domain
MHRQDAPGRRRFFRGHTGSIALLLLAGCAGTPGNPFASFTPTHRMIDEAKDLRAAAPLPAALPRELDKRPAPPFVVEPGDVLLVQPADIDSPVRLPGDQPVLIDGTIQLGKYGKLTVAGKTADEIEAAVKSLVDAQTTDKDAPVGPITVRVVTRQSKVYYVLGEVNAPGAFTLNGRETVLDALLAAGGLTDRASRKNIILSRPTGPCSPRIVLPVCYPEIVQLGDTGTNYQIAAGDRIYVSSKSCWEDLQPNKTCPPCGLPQTPQMLPPEPRCAGGACGAPPASIATPSPAP